MRNSNDRPRDGVHGTAPQPAFIAFVDHKLDSLFFISFLFFSNDAADGCETIGVNNNFYHFVRFEWKMLMNFVGRCHFDWRTMQFASLSVCISGQSDAESFHCRMPWLKLRWLWSFDESTVRGSPDVSIIIIIYLQQHHVCGQMDMHGLGHRRYQ